jgi:hypothetical protein
VIARRDTESGWQTGQHRLDQNESKTAQSSAELELRGSTAVELATTSEAPHLHRGQDRSRAEFCRSVGNVLGSAAVAQR